MLSGKSTIRYDIHYVVVGKGWWDSGWWDRDPRRNRDLDIPKYRTSIVQKSFKYRGIKIWADLDTQFLLRSDIPRFNFFNS